MTLSSSQKALLDALRHQRRAARPSMPAPVSPAGVPPRPEHLRAVAPMSPLQQQLWIVDRTQPASPAYLVTLAWELSGPVDPDRLQAALDALVARHEGLRVTFGADGDRLHQTVHPSVAVPLASGGGLDDAEPMDLERGPLVRARVVRGGSPGGADVLLLTVHHIVTDEWSADVIARELSALYTDLSALDGAPLPVQSPDVAVWQQDWLASADAAQELDYWTSALAGAPPVLELPADRPRPAVQSFAGASVPVRLDVPAEQVQALCRQLAVTPFALLLTVFQVLMSRLSGQADVVTGVPVSQRDRAELTGLVGFFVNTAAIRTDLGDDPSFRAAAARVADAVRGAQAHQHVPFDRVVQAVRPPRRSDRGPLVQVMFVHQSSPAGAVLRLGGVTGRPMVLPASTAKFEFTLSLGDDLCGQAEYCTALFDEATVHRMVRLFETLLAAAVAAPDLPVSQLPLLPAGVPHALHGPVTPAAADVLDRFAAHVASAPDAPAAADASRTLSFAQLDALADSAAQSLRAEVGRGGLVVLKLPRGLDLLVGILAAWKLGAAYVPVDPATPPARLDALLARIRPAAVVDSPLPTAPADPIHTPVTGDDLAYVLFTSGSTGVPKGVQVTRGGLANYAAWAAGFYGAAGGAGSVTHSSPGFDLTVTSMLVPLFAGSPVRLLPADAPASALGEHLATAGTALELVKLTPAHLDLVAAQLGPDRVAGRASVLVVGGENLLASQVQVWRDRAAGTRVVNEYGPTETVVGCAVHEVGPGTPVSGSVPIGVPIANTTLYVLDRHLRPVPAGVPGELYVAGAGVARGYLGQPGETAQRFLPDPFAAGRMYRTGDVVRLLPGGELEFLHRTDGQVKVRGFRVETGEVEAALTALPGICAAAVVVREDTPGDRRLVGYVVGDAAGARDALRAVLPDYLVPAELVVLDALPLTGNGKVDRVALPAPVAPAPVPAAGSAAERVAAVWRELLRRDDIRADESFFDAGGHSLLLLAAHARLLPDFPSLSVTDLFRYPTIGALAQHLTATVPAALPAAAPAPVGEPIAVIGLACRFPDASTVDEFWANICAGRDSVRAFTREQALADGADPADVDDPRYVLAGTVLDGLADFDADLFELTPREAQILDPGHRLFLECSWEALEQAGVDPASAKVGMFAGSGRGNYLHEHLLPSRDLVRGVGEYQLTLSNDKDFLPTRASYKLNLRGPSVSVNTACSTALVAVHQARLSLLAGECDVALAGGVSVIASQHRGYLHQTGGIGSPDGHCRPFDAAGNGIVGSSGAGVVVLKRLDAALRDGDTVHAVIRGSAVNNDGADKVGFTAPGVAGQAEVVAQALAASGVSTRDVGLIEAHGTATQLGDPIEVAALTQVFGPDGPPIALGSVKANIGHTDAAAGAAGLIKAICAVKHAVLPPAVGFTAPHPGIDFGRFTPGGVRREWTDARRVAGVSSFGMGGTNAHVVVEQPPPPAPSTMDDAPQLLLVSAHTPTALDTATERLRAHLAAHPDRLADAAATLRHGRRPLQHRRILVGDNTFAGVSRPAAPDVALILPGQGTQQPGMAHGLYRNEPRFAATVDHCATILAPVLGLDLRDVLFAGAGDLADTRLTQPALFTVEYALARLLADLGVTPAAMLGHSIGEYVAATLAGVFDLDDALRLVALRGSLVAALPGGSMLALTCTEDEALQHCDGTLDLAAINAADLCVVSGPTAGVQALHARVGGKLLSTSHAFHSRLLDPVLDTFHRAVAQVPTQAPAVPYLSNLTGDWATPGQARDPGYWVAHLRGTVRFADGLAKLAGHTTVHCGPGRTPGAIPALPRDPGTGRDPAALLEAVGRVWLTGAPVDWAAFDSGRPRRRIPLPTYPFERSRHWIDRPSTAPSAVSAPVAAIAVEAEAAPQSTVDRMVAVWRDLLGIAHIGASDDFFDLGGHSLAATQLLARIRDVFGVELPLDAVFASATPAGLAALVDTALPAAASETSTVEARGHGYDTRVSYAQRRMWFLDQAHADPEAAAAYAVGLALRLDGDLDQAALQQALDQLAARHEILRTTFPAPDGEPVQRIHPPAPVTLHRQATADIDASLRTATRQRFDLAAGPLWQATLWTVDPGPDQPAQTVLSVILHHIIGDGWSLGVLADDLGALYTGRPRPATLQYADYTEQQARQVERTRDTDLAYWRERLTGAAPTLDLPTDLPRPAVQTFAGATEQTVLPAGLADAVRVLGRNHQATLYMTMLAAWQALLHRYSGQTDLVIGSPVAGRTGTSHRDAIGCYLNTLALRGTVDGRTRFTDLLTQARTTALAAYTHQDIPFERVVDDLNPPRDLSRNAVFQVMLNVLNLPETHTDFGPHLHATRLEINPGAAAVDLILYVYEEPAGLRVVLEYNTGLYLPGTARRMLDHLTNLLAAAAADATLTVDDLPLLDHAELHQHLVGFNDTALPVPGKCLHDLILDQAARTPDRPAVTYGDTTLTYDDLNRGSAVIAARLRDHGVTPDTPVAVELDRTEDLIVTLLGVLRAGGAYVPLDPSYPQDRRAYILDHSQAAVIIDADGTRTLRTSPDTPAPAPVSPDNAAYILYTSGSTGRPKGVKVTHRSVANFLASMTREPGLTSDDTLVAVTTFAFDISVLELFGPLTVGARVVIAGRDQSLDAAELAHLLTREQATILQATPATWRLLLADDWPGNPRLKALCGGEALPVPVALALTSRVAELWNLYGPTETTIWSTTTRVQPAPDGTIDVHIGHPIANTTCHILDRQLRPCPIGVTGDLYIGGHGLARDYHRQPGLTADRFIPDPYSGGRLYRTGDRARRRPDGNIDFLGRNDTQVKVRGYRIELGEIETTLASHPAVREAVVIVRDDALLAYLVPAADTDVEPADLRTHLRQSLPDYMIPAAFAVLDQLPLTPNGKVDRRNLPDPQPQRHTSGGTPPQTELQHRLARHWADILGHDQLGIDDNFFDLGGDSFKAVRAVRGLDGINAGVLDLFKHPTIRDFSARFDTSTPAPTGPVPLLNLLTPRGRQTTLNLVCLPFAGGGAITYQSLAGQMPDHVALWALQAPGHDLGTTHEQLIGFDQIVTGAAEEIKQLDGPTVLYGHCMGGALTIALAQHLEADDIPLERVMIGGHFPVPRLPGRIAAWMRRILPMEKRTSKRQSLDFLRAMGFFTENLTRPEQDYLMGVFLRDAQEAEDYYTAYYARDQRTKLRAPLISIIGDADRATELYQERHQEWREFADDVTLEVIPHAGHYFQKHQAAELADIIINPGKARHEVPAAPPPASLRTFATVAGGQFISLVGTGLTTFAMGLWVLQHTGSITLFALTSMLALLPAVLLAPIAGAVADRWDKRKIMLLADTGAAVGTVTLASLLWLGTLQLWHIWLVVSIGAIANAFQQPAYLAAITQLVPKRYYGRANGIAQLGGATGTVLAPLLGGALAATIGLPGIVLIDLTTFLIAVTATLIARFPDSLFIKREETFGKEILGGWRYITRRKGLVAIIAYTSVLNFMFGMVEVLTTPLVLTLTRPGGLGAILACTGVGLLAGSILMTLWGGTIRRTTGILGGFLAIGASMLLIGLRPHPIYPALGLLGLGLATAILNAHWLAIVQAKVGLELQGRVIATTLMFSWAMVPAGFLTSGPLATRVFEPLMQPGGALAPTLGALIGTGPGRGTALLIIVSGLLTLVLGVSAFAYPRVRRLEDELPDAIPAPVVITDKDLLQQQADELLEPAHV